MRIKNFMSLLVAPVLFATTSCGQDAMKLYEDAIPNSKASANTEVGETTNGILRIRNVSVPTLTMYKPTAASAKKAAIIICPGGGYRILAANHEGSDVAKVFAGWGITAFVLKYRLPDDSIMIHKEIGPLQDAQRAIQLVRENAVKWDIDPQKIGIMGFSAGGHLASTASTHFEKAVIENKKNTSLRPDFSVLIYPVISFTDSLAHMGSRESLIGQNAPADRIIDYSNELQVNAKTPPAFLVHSYDDETVKVANSQRYHEALQRNHIPSELRLYEKGGHGYGMNNKTTSDQWMERLKTWLQSNGYL